MDVAVVKRVVRLGAGRQAAGLSRARQREDVVVGAGARRRVGRVAVVIAQRRLEHAAAERGRVHVEDRGLEFGIGAVLIGVVAEHQPQIRLR